MGLSNSVASVIRLGIEQGIRQKSKKQTLLQAQTKSSIAFCIVHWNAPQFLLLTIKQIEALHPECKIYVLDNGSKQANLSEVASALRRYNNITLFATRKPLWAEKLGIKLQWQSHTAGLQFLTNFSASQSDKFAVFLDQDCILSKRVDDLLPKLNKNAVLIGARDRVIVPHDYGPLRKGYLRNCYNFIHPSFLIMEPSVIRSLFGSCSFYDKRTTKVEFYPKKSEPEPYHGLSFKASDKILFMEPKMHPEIPFLTSYSYNDTIYAWHAWYSSRTTETKSAQLDGYPVPWLREINSIEFKFMEDIYRKTAFLTPPFAAEDTTNA